MGYGDYGGGSQGGAPSGQGAPGAEHPSTPTAQVPHTPRPSQYDADFIVVGSGAGGGTVAARLVENGFSVLLLEAGGDPRSAIGSRPHMPGVNTLPDDYDVPAFHPFSVENSAMRWDFFVRHFSNQDTQQKDPAYRAEHDGKPVDGVLYPRAGTLGGCTAHNALIFVYPHNADWNQIADLTGDPSWRAEKMREYFERLEKCEHRPDERPAGHVGKNPSRHGWDGWLQTESAIPSAAIFNRDLRKTILETTKTVLRDPEFALTDSDRRARLESQLDPNDWRVVKDDAIGLRYTPLTTKGGKRMGTRERVLEVQKKHPDRLKVQLHALATRVLFDERNHAIGVEYQSGEALYGAHAQPSAAPGSVKQVFAAREVILAGGAFNTPQLLMLSGIGA
ncbi:MAG: GMC family oxidoreductase N-terminal domain-containing protein, partial [Vicinamibacterales bacterium]